MLAARMLWPKGVDEFVRAASILEERGVECRMVLVGDTDPGNAAAVPRSALRAWQEEGIVEWWGHSDSIVETFRDTNVICLPSYREGLPRVLLEAASCGRALVANDVPGCREVCRHNENGLLVPPFRPELLADAIEKLVEDHELRHRFALRGRQIVVEEFSVGRITDLALMTYRDLFSGPGIGG